MSASFDLVARINQAVRDPDSIVTNDGPREERIVHAVLNVIGDYEHHWRTQDAEELRRLAAGSDDGDYAYRDAASIVDSRRA